MKLLSQRYENASIVDDSDVIDISDSSVRFCGKISKLLNNLYLCILPRYMYKNVFNNQIFVEFIYCSLQNTVWHSTSVACIR